ncbi:MAG: hypothetical protein U0903_04885 [Planctomycetales bacterium]
MHTFLRKQLPLGLLSTLVMVQTAAQAPLHAQQGEGQGNRPVRLQPANKRPAEPRRLNSTIVPAVNPNLPKVRSVPVRVRETQSPQAAPIPSTPEDSAPVQQMAGPQPTVQQNSGQPTTGQRSEIQRQLDEMYRQQGLKAPAMNYQSLPQVQAAQAQSPAQGDDSEEEGEDEEAAPQQPNGAQQRTGMPMRQMPSTAIRGTQPGQGGQNPQEPAYKEPNLLKRWFGPRRKPEQPQAQRPQQFSQQGQGMPRAPQGQQVQNRPMTPSEPPNAQMFNPQAQQPAQPAAQPAQQQPQLQVQQPTQQTVQPPAQPVAQQPPARPGRATLESGNPQRGPGQPQGTPRPRTPATPTAQSQVVVPVQTPAQPARQNPEEEETQDAAQQQAAPREDDIPRLSDEPIQEQEKKTAEAPKKPAAPEKKNPFENLEIYTPDEPKSAAPAAETPAKEPAASEAPPAAAGPETATPKMEVPQTDAPKTEIPKAETPKTDAAPEKQAGPESTAPTGKPVSTPPGKTSMQDLQTRPQAVLFLDGEDDEQREKYRMLAAFPEKSGFKGFCPTVLRDERDLVRGRKNYQLTYHKHVYVFSSAKALATAQAHPEKYLPAAEGQDVVLLKEAENVDGSLDAAAWYRGRLYLFASRRNLELFAANPTLYVGTETTIPMSQEKGKPALKVTEQPAEVSDDEEEMEESEEEAKENKAPARNQSPASILNGPSSTPKSNGSGNPVPPPPASEESDEPTMPGKKIRAAKFSDNKTETIRTRTVIRVSVPGK